MRTLFDIVQAAKDGEDTTHEECLYSMLVLTGLLNMLSVEMLEVAEKPSRAQFWADESYERYQKALNTGPQKYLGPNVPGNAGYDDFRKVGKRVVDAVLKEAHNAPQTE